MSVLYNSLASYMLFRRNCGKKEQDSFKDFSIHLLYLHKWFMLSCLFFLQKFDVQDVTTTVTIADDYFLHIKKILGTVARMAIEMDKMSKVLP